MKRIIFLILFLIIMIGLMAQTAVLPLGDGTEGNPYQIATWQNLYWITAPDTVDGLTQADRWSKHYFQTADIDFADAIPAINTWDNGAGWTPIGFYVASENSYLIFKGSYDGHNKTITGLYINRPSVDYQGLFGFSGDTSSTACITNINLIDINVTGNYYTGGLVGDNFGIITNCFSSGSVTGSHYIGGLVGHNYCCTISNCYSTGSVTGYYYTGGLVGNNYCGTIFNCYSTGSVTGNNYTGGLVGNNYCGKISNCYSTGSVTGNYYTGGLVGDNSGLITNCYSTGSVTATADVSGGLVGRNGYSSSINNCYSTGSVVGNSYTGGLVGVNEEYNSINNCYSTGSVVGNSYTGGLVGINAYNIPITNSFWDIQTSGQSTSAGGTGKTTAEMQTQSTYSNAGWNFCFPWKMVNNSFPVLKTFEELNVIGFGSASSPFEIANFSQLVWLSNDPSVWDKHFLQTADITFPAEINTWNNGTGWSPIGQNNNLSFTGTYDGDNKTIRGLFINNPSADNQGFFGFTNTSEIKNIGLINTNITGKNKTSALVGWNGGLITNCYITGSVTGDYSVGGLVGYDSGTIITCSNSGSVTGDYSVGGLVGRGEGTITKCYNIGSVTGNNETTGGLVGENSSSVTYCYNSGNVTGNLRTGGLVGNNFRGIIANCNNLGHVTGDDYIGGLVGDNSSTITKSYSTGIVTGNENTGGLVGNNNNDETVSNSFWDTETSGQATSAGGTGKTTAEMKTILTFTDAGWDFIYVWDINPELNDGYPYLHYPISVANDDIVIIQPTDTKAILKNAYPNPFNPSTTLSFELSFPELVSIDIYNVKGQLVKTLVKGSYNTGKHSIVWDGKDNKGKSACSGVYFYKMQAGKDSQTKKMMLMK